jgi:hypothetical protein
MKNTEFLMNEAISEVKRAKELYPEPDHLTLALAEKAGEVTKAVLDHMDGKGSIFDVRKEIVQCVAMCIRLWEEGDPTVSLPPVGKFTSLGD